MILRVPMLSALLAGRKRRERARQAAIWAKHPADLDAAWPDDLVQEMRVDGFWHDLRERWSALKALWGPAIKDRPRDRRKGWTVYDGFVRARSEEWTISRGICATIGILLDRRWSDRASRRWSRRHERASCWADVRNLAHWDSRSDGYGWSAGTLRLAPGCRVEIGSEGESYL